MLAKTEDLATYTVDQPAKTQDDEDCIVSRAMNILKMRLCRADDVLSSPSVVRDYLKLRLASLEYEAFCCIFLGAQNGLIAIEEMSRGTLTQTSVYPREIVKAALKHNAASVIFAHNHPSGMADPSTADECLTKTLKSALALVDVRVLDHFIVAGADTPLSFAERGIL